MLQKVMVNRRIPSAEIPGSAWAKTTILPWIPKIQIFKDPTTSNRRNQKFTIFWTRKSLKFKRPTHPKSKCFRISWCRRRMKLGISKLWKMILIWALRILRHLSTKETKWCETRSRRMPAKSCTSRAPWKTNLGSFWGSRPWFQKIRLKSKITKRKICRAINN